MNKSYLSLFFVLSLLSTLTLPLIIPSAASEAEMKKYSIEPPNLEISGISANKRVVGLKCVMTLGINVTNYGVAAETFNATFYANSTIIHETLNATVDGQNSTILVFKWTVVGLAYGNYSISASITPVFNETNLSDNFIDGLWIFVTIMGDFNGDKWVDIFDLIMFANGWSPGGYHPCVYPWYPPSINPAVDYDDCGKIDIYHAILLAGWYGKHWE